MRWYPSFIPTGVAYLWPNYLWHFNRAEKIVYLTFDDGPTPQVTQFVLEQLKKYQAKATFFCIGDAVQRHPDIYDQILNQGHSVGNHTMHHLHNWKNPDKVYLNDIELAKQHIDSNLFRPPYGKIKSKVVKELIKKGYDIVMWEVLSGDFDQNRSPESCLKSLKKHTKNGSIVVFHDSIKAKERLYKVLPKYLYFLTENGYEMRAIRHTGAPY
jgi:peptidoglycan/xylan/chitin deacetylase (PgdA/CDA1 family)